MLRMLWSDSFWLNVTNIGLGAATVGLFLYGLIVGLRSRAAAGPPARRLRGGHH